jgi:hypothetical protein
VYAERLEEVAADDQTIDQLRLAILREVDALRSPRDSPVECVGSLPEPIPHRVVPPEPRFEAQTNRRVRRNGDETLRLPRWQRAQQKAVDEREDRGVGADAERQRERRNRRDNRCRLQRPNRKSEIIHVFTVSRR